MTNNDNFTNKLPWFFFGTLMDSDILQLVIGRSVTEQQQQAAILLGHRRVRVADETYPTLLLDTDAKVEGLVVSGLSDRESERVCFFEGDEFVPEICEVQLLADQQMINAWLFIGTDNLLSSNQNWCLQQWQQLHKQSFLPMVNKYMQGMHKTDAEVLEQHWQQAKQRYTFD